MRALPEHGRSMVMNLGICLSFVEGGYVGLRSYPFVFVSVLPFFLFFHFAFSCPRFVFLSSSSFRYPQLDSCLPYATTRSWWPAFRFTLNYGYFPERSLVRSASQASR